MPTSPRWSASSALGGNPTFAEVVSARSPSNQRLTPPKDPYHLQPISLTFRSLYPTISTQSPKVLPFVMPASKKTLRAQESRKKELAGTKVATNAGGVPKKAEKPKTQCQICKGEFIATMPTVLRDHASNRHVKNTFDQCFPNIPA